MASSINLPDLGSKERERIEKEKRDRLRQNLQDLGHGLEMGYKATQGDPIPLLGDIAQKMGKGYEFNILNQARQDNWGPALTEVLKHTRLRNAIGDGRLTFDLHLRNPYIGFRYNF